MSSMVLVFITAFSTSRSTKVSVCIFIPCIAFFWCNQRQLKAWLLVAPFGNGVREAPELLLKHLSELVAWWTLFRCNHLTSTNENIIIFSGVHNDNSSGAAKPDFRDQIQPSLYGAVFYHRKSPKPFRNIVSLYCTKFLRGTGLIERKDMIPLQR